MRLASATEGWVGRRWKSAGESSAARMLSQYRDQPIDGSSAPITCPRRKISSQPSERPAKSVSACSSSNGLEAARTASTSRYRSSTPASRIALSAAHLSANADGGEEEEEEVADDGGACSKTAAAGVAWACAKAAESIARISVGSRRAAAASVKAASSCCWPDAALVTISWCRRSEGRRDALDASSELRALRRATQRGELCRQPGLPPTVAAGTKWRSLRFSAFGDGTVHAPFILIGSAAAGMDANGLPGADAFAPRASCCRIRVEDGGCDADVVASAVLGGDDAVVPSRAPPPLSSTIEEE